MPNISLDTALHTAARVNNLEVVQILLQHGADINMPNISLDTALHTAARVNNLEVVQTLLEYGADINMLNRSWDTPLHAACLFDKPHMVNLLLSMGADPYIMNKDNRKPRDIYKEGIIPCIFIHHEVVALYKIVACQLLSNDDKLCMVTQLAKYCHNVKELYGQLSTQKKLELQSILQLPNQEISADCPLVCFIKFLINKILSLPPSPYLKNVSITLLEHSKTVLKESR